MAPGTDRVALVTGASGGSVRRRACAAGAGFTVYGRSRKAAIGRSETECVLPLYVTDDVSVAGAVREVLGRSGRIDVLVNNAGIGSSGASEGRAPSPRTGWSSTSTSSASSA